MTRKYINEFQRDFKLFNRFDRNGDQYIDRDEWMDYLVSQASQNHLTYNDLYKFFRDNAENVCKDPRPQPFKSDISDFDAVLAPLSDIWFLLDMDRDGHASPADLANAFRGMDFDEDGNITELEFHQKANRGLLEMCYQLAVMSDSEDDCSVSIDQVGPKKKQKDSDD